MLPLFIDVSRLSLVLVGNGEPTLRRLRRLEEAGALRIAVYAAAPSGALAEAAGTRLVRRWPSLEEIAGGQLVFIADAPDRDRAILAAASRALGVLVHVEDDMTLSDAQAPAVLRRGDLTLAVSTNGASPTLAAEVRDFLGGLFGPEWQGRLDALSRQRRAWRAAGLMSEAIARLTGEWIRSRGWLALEPASATAPDTASATRH
jgi:precorrin-2 dehydrogenase/sirohydrochlorin ferrochelatase